MSKPAARLQREYLYTPEELCKLLDLAGDRVFKITCEYGIYSFWTTAEGDVADV